MKENEKLIFATACGCIVLILCILSALVPSIAISFYHIKTKVVNTEGKIQHTINTIVVNKHDFTIANKTWYYDNNWTGEICAIYYDTDNNLHCIHEVLGSGVYAVSGKKVNCYFEKNTNDKIIIDGITYTYNDKEDKLVSSEGQELTLYADYPLLYTPMGIIKQETITDPHFDISLYFK